MTARLPTWRQLNALAREQNMNLYRPTSNDVTIRTDGHLKVILSIEGWGEISGYAEDKVIRAATEAALRALRSKR